MNTADDGFRVLGLGESDSPSPMRSRSWVRDFTLASVEQAVAELLSLKQASREGDNFLVWNAPAEVEQLAIAGDPRAMALGIDGVQHRLPEWSGRDTEKLVLDIRQGRVHHAVGSERDAAVAQALSYFGARLLDTTLDAILVADDRHWITSSGAHVERWVRLAPVLSIAGVPRLLASHIRHRIGVSGDVNVVYGATATGQLAALVAGRGITAKLGGPPLAPTIDRRLAGELGTRDVVLLVDIVCSGGYLSRAIHELRRHNLDCSVATVVRYTQFAGRTIEPPITSLISLIDLDDLWYRDSGTCPLCRGTTKAHLTEVFSDEANEFLSFRRAGRAKTSTSTAWQPHVGISWGEFASLLASCADAIGLPEPGADCNHCHHGQVVDLTVVNKHPTEWARLVSWGADIVMQVIEDRHLPETEPLYVLTPKHESSRRLAEDICAKLVHPTVAMVCQQDSTSHEVSTRGLALPSGAACVVLDESIFAGHTVEALASYCWTQKARLLAVLTPFWCSDGSNAAILAELLTHRDVPLYAWYAPSFRWHAPADCKMPNLRERLGNAALNRSSPPALVAHLRSLASDSAAGPRGRARELYLGRMLGLRPLNPDTRITATLQPTTEMFYTAVQQWPRGADGSGLADSFAVAAADFAAKASYSTIASLLDAATDPECSDARLLDAVADLINGLPSQSSAAWYNRATVAVDRSVSRRLDRGHIKLLVALLGFLWEAKPNAFYSAIETATRHVALCDLSVDFLSALAPTLLRRPLSDEESKYRWARLGDSLDRAREAIADPAAAQEVADMGIVLASISRSFRTRPTEIRVRMYSCELESPELLSMADLAKVREQLGPGFLLVDLIESRATVVGGKILNGRPRRGVETRVAPTSTSVAALAVACMLGGSVTKRQLDAYFAMTYAPDLSKDTARKACLAAAELAGVTYSDGLLTVQAEWGLLDRSNEPILSHDGLEAARQRR